MTYHRGTRTRMVISTALVLLLGGALVAWEALRGNDASGARTGGGATRFDPAAMQAALDDFERRAFSPLAPPVVPKNLGNPTPFPLPERRL